jgi:uncharacterized protein YndB with AHSA1/START domain
MQPEPFVIERTFDAPVESVWQAITDKEKMKGWYFDLESFRAEPGFEFRFYGGDEKMQFLHICQVKDVEKNKKLSYSWRYDGYTGESLVTFELFKEGEKTRLRLTHSGLDTFPSNIPSFAKENFAAGWTQIVGTSLKDYLQKNTARIVTS